MSEITLADYARLAEAIGMKRQTEWRTNKRVWYDGGKPICTEDSGLLEDYLAEPAQMSRILRAELPGDQWLLNNHHIRTSEWVVTRSSAHYGLVGSAIADTPEKAVRDCGALALREGT